MIFEKSYDVKRKATGSFTKGKFTDGAETTIQIMANIQPITGKEWVSLEIGRKDLGKINVYTLSSLNVSATSQSPDVVIYNGYKYELLTEEKVVWSPLTYNKYMGEFRE